MALYAFDDDLVFGTVIFDWIQKIAWSEQKLYSNNFRSSVHQHCLVFFHQSLEVGASVNLPKTKKRAQVFFLRIKKKMGRVVGLTLAQRGPNGDHERITLFGAFLLADFFRSAGRQRRCADEPDPARLRPSGRATNCSAVRSPSFEPLLIRQVRSPSRLRLIIPFCL